MTQTDLSPVEITTPRIEYTGEPPLAVWCPNCGALHEADAALAKARGEA